MPWSVFAGVEHGFDFDKIHSFPRLGALSARAGELSAGGANRLTVLAVGQLIPANQIWGHVRRYILANEKIMSWTTAELKRLRFQLDTVTERANEVHEHVCKTFLSRMSKKVVCIFFNNFNNWSVVLRCSQCWCQHFKKGVAELGGIGKVTTGYRA